MGSDVKSKVCLDFALRQRHLRNIFSNAVTLQYMYRIAQ